MIAGITEKNFWLDNGQAHELAINNCLLYCFKQPESSPSGCGGGWKEMSAGPAP